MLSHVMHHTTPDYQSYGYAVKTVDQSTNALFQLGDSNAGVTKAFSEVAKLGPDCAELSLGRCGSRALNDEGTPSRANDNPTFPFELADRGLGGVQSHPMVRHQGAVGGQARSDRESPGIHVGPEAVRETTARPSLPFGGQVVIHARRAYGTCRATAPLGFGEVPTVLEQRNCRKQ